MPSKDPINAEANGWMRPEDRASSESEKRPETTRAVGSGGKREMSAQVQRLARRQGKDPDELAKKLDADTLRRTKYPVIEEVDAEGRRTFKHDIGVTEGLIALRR